MLPSHARDNLINFFPFPSRSRDLRPIRPGPGAATAVPSVESPAGLDRAWSLAVNAMAYCKIGLMRLGWEEEVGGKGKGKECGLVAVPALTKDHLVRPTAAPPTCASAAFIAHLFCAFLYT